MKQGLWGFSRDRVEGGRRGSARRTKPAGWEKAGSEARSCSTTNQSCDCKYHFAFENSGNWVWVMDWGSTTVIVTIIAADTYWALAVCQTRCNVFHGLTHFILTSEVVEVTYKFASIYVNVQEQPYHKAFSQTHIAVISNDSILALHDLFPWMVSVSSVPWLLSRQEKKRQCIPQHFPHYRSPFVPMQIGTIRFWIGNWNQTCRGVPPSITFTVLPLKSPCDLKSHLPSLGQLPLL